MVFSLTLWGSAVKAKAGMGTGEQVPTRTFGFKDTKQMNGYKHIQPKVYKHVWRMVSTKFKTADLHGHEASWSPSAGQKF